ncbi:MAG: PadR family transcriptional regulator [Propionibacteriaceae bacterium]|nr:PadR family transcriptional regulator [Propionibacteriaceae bacterium]
MRRARPGQVRDSILRLLSERPLNGYQIMTSLAEKTMDAWQPSPGAIYPALNQLEDEGLIQAVMTDQQKVFTLTDAGQAVVADLPEEPWSGREPALTQRNAAMEQLRFLAHTIRYAGQTGTPDQLTAIAVQLESTRKSILAILAAAD